LSWEASEYIGQTISLEAIANDFTKMKPFTKFQIPKDTKIITARRDSSGRPILPNSDYYPEDSVYDQC
jgi:hypothetical protein